MLLDNDSSPVGPLSVAPVSSVPRSRRRPARAALHAVRRAHLYLGLFLFPWAVLYGVTAFLFNHPTAFSDQPTTTFTADAVRGTPLDELPSADGLAAGIVAVFNDNKQPATPYVLAGDARFAREFAFATVKSDDATLNVLIDVKNGGGTVRQAAARPKVEAAKAPFATGGAAPRGGRGGSAARTPRGGDTKFDSALADRIKAGVPMLFERLGLPCREVIVTSIPDVVMPIEAEGRTWTATVNAMTGAVSGAPADAPEGELGWRRFLLRLHTAHGYPGDTNARWFWAVLVDLMAFVMCFWSVSGLLMWWQLKAARQAGLLTLVLSGAAAIAIGVAMHAAIAAQR